MFRYISSSCFRSFVMLLLIAVCSYQPAMAQDRDQSRVRQAELLLNQGLSYPDLMRGLMDMSDFSEEEVKAINLYCFSKIRSARADFLEGYVAGEYQDHDLMLYFGRFKRELQLALDQERPWDGVKTKGGKKPHHHDHDHDHDHGHAKAPNGPCTNVDFETCDFTGWDLFEGQVNTNPYEMINAAAAAPGTQHVITNGGNDPTVGIPMVNPNGGTCSVQLGDGTGVGGLAASMTQTFLVSPQNAVFTYSYALVLEDPSGHTNGEKPFFKVNMYDQNGNSITCADYQVIAGPPSSGGDPDFVAYNGGFYLPWRTTFAPLDGYIGQNVTVEFIIGDCSQSGHYGYGYVDASCNPLGVIASDTVICGNQNVTLTAPAGAASYQWSNGATGQQIVVSNPGYYSVDVTPVTGSACAITLDITVQGSPGVPTAAFTAAPNPICINETVSFTDQSVVSQNGTIQSWEWDFGDGVGTSTLQSPTYMYPVAGTYDAQLVVVSVGGCTDTITQTITVNPSVDATVTPAGPYCDSDPAAIMTAVDPGGTWTASCGACINGASGSFDPAVAGIGTHDIIYTINSGCPDADTISVVVDGISIDNVVSVDPLCAGSCDGSISITAAGAVDYSIDNGVNWQNNGTFNALCAGNYDLRVRNANGCEATQPLTLTDPPQLTFNFSAFDAICYGACDGYAIVIPSGGTGAYTYNWTTGAAANQAQSSNLCAGTYSLSISDANGCTVDTNNWVINEPAPFVITAITTVDEFCAGDCTGSIDITAPGAVSYSIDGGATTSGSNVFANQCAGNYTIQVIDAAGCVADSSAAISGPPALLLGTLGDTTICIGGDADISASASGGTAPYTFNWDNGLPSQANQNVSPGATTIYNVSVTDANGCAIAPQPVVVQYFPPINVIALSDQSLCYGSSASISAIAQGGNGGPYTYVWDQNLGNGQQQTVAPLNTTVYAVTASDNCETPDAQAQVTITINPVPTVDLEADRLEGCMPLTTNFTNLTPAQFTTADQCIWTFGDGSPAELGCTGPTHTYTEPGCYDVSLTVTSAEGCTSDTTLTNYICVYDFPTAEFTFGPQPTTFLEPEISFTNQSTTPAPGYITDFQWQFDNYGTSDLNNPTFEFPGEEPGSYDVCLNVINNYGCEDEICYEVVIGGEFLIYVPNAFTPDGDGVNDVFLPQGVGISDADYVMYIFNRWGEIVFTSESKDFGWDGRFKGQAVESEVYVWKLFVKDEWSREEHEMHGHVTVLR